MGPVLATSYPFLLLLCPTLLAKREGGAVPDGLPPIVRESLVGFGHAVHVFLLLDCRALAVSSIEQLIRELVDHALFGTQTRIGQNPANRQRSPAIGVHFYGNLVVGTAHAAGLHFQQRLYVLHRFLEQFQSFVAALLLQLLHRLVEDSLRGALLAVPHHRVDELVDQRRAVDRVRQRLPLRYMTFSRHLLSSLFPADLGRYSHATPSCAGGRFEIRCFVPYPSRAFGERAGRFLRLRSLRAVLRPSLLAVGNANRIQGSPNHVIAHARQVLHTAATNQHDRVFLQVVADARNVGR